MVGTIMRGRITDYRLAGIERNWLVQPGDFMRVPDEVLKCAVFLGREEEGLYRDSSTGFIVRVPFESKELGHGESGFNYLVTAKHNILKYTGYVYGATVNNKSGSRMEPVKVRPDSQMKWWYHPTEPNTVDVAVTTWIIEKEDDTAYIPIIQFTTDERIIERHLGPGDSVFITGLFSKLTHGTKNVPIIRTGNVATLEDGVTVSTRIGGTRCDMSAYLIEARSIGGLSGSPVFVRETVIYDDATLTYAKGSKKEKGVAYLTGQFHFLGLIHGHWEIDPDDKNEDNPRILPKSDSTVNMGIAMVVPAKKILETLYQKELIEMRRKTEEEILNERHGETSQDFDDGRTSFTADDFLNSLKKVSQRLPQPPAAPEGPEDSSPPES